MRRSDLAKPRSGPLWGKNRHYRWSEIRRENFLNTASDCKVSDADKILDELIERTATAIDKAGEKLPPKFPMEVVDAIFDGLRKAAKTLARKGNVRYGSIPLKNSTSD